MKKFNFRKKRNFQNKVRINRKAKVFMLASLLLILLGLVIWILRGVNAWFEVNRLVFKKPVEIAFNSPISVEERRVEMAEIVRVIETIPNPEDLETEPEQLIYEYFGLEHYRMAIAVSRCEGLNHPADGFNVNTNGSIDVGYMRINSINFKLDGCSLLEVATPKGNIACGYKIWDRGDGEEGNRKGNFDRWVGYTNGCALTKYE